MNITIDSDDLAKERVELHVTTDGVRTWTVRAETVQRAAELDRELREKYGDPADQSDGPRIKFFKMKDYHNWEISGCSSVEELAAVDAQMREKYGEKATG